MLCLKDNNDSFYKNKTGDYIELFVAFFTSDSEIESNERRLIQEFKLKWNIVLNGYKV